MDGFPMLGSPPLEAAATAAVAANSPRPRKTILRTLLLPCSRVTGVATRSTLVRIACLTALAAAVAAVAAGAGLAGARHVTKAPTVQTKKIKGLGTVLVNGKGFTLYIFVPDHHKKVTCKGACAAIWPPLKVKKGHKPTAGGAAKKKLLGLDGRVVTYNHWPLYTYVTDTRPGDASGQGVNNFGLWYVISPAGKVIKKNPAP